MDFKYSERANFEIESLPTALGDGVTLWTDTELNKLVKYASQDSTMVQCAGGDQIDGIVQKIESHTVNGGYSFGAVVPEGDFVVEVGANQVGTLAVNTMVVADTQVAIGTAGYGKVKAVAGSVYSPWKCIRIVSGTGVSGDKVLIRRV